jgi:hypothetical protein
MILLLLFYNDGSAIEDQKFIETDIWISANRIEIV